MNGRRAVIGLCMLCALLISAIGAQGASAAGTTAYTCKKVEPPSGAGFSKAHCKAADAVASNAAYAHVEIPAGEQTVTTVTNAGNGTNTETTVSQVLNGKILGVSVGITCTGVTGTGTQTNVANTEEPKTSMRISGTSALNYTGCTTKVPNCTIKNPIEANTTVESTHTGVNEKEKGLTFKQVGEQFTKIVFQGESCAIAGTYPVTGKAVGRVDGATITFNTGEDELKLGPEAADITGTVTVSGRKTTEVVCTPLSITTTEK
jgi:hypothetical protein